MESLWHTAILKKFEFLHQFSKKQNMIKKNYQLNWTEKFVDKAQQCFAFLPIKPKFKFSVEWSWLLEKYLIFVIFIFSLYPMKKQMTPLFWIIPNHPRRVWVTFFLRPQKVHPTNLLNIFQAWQTNCMMVSTWLSKVRVITEKIAATLELVAAACNCFQSSCFQNAYRTKSSDN